MNETIKGLTIAGQAMKARLEAYGIPFRITRIVAGSEPSVEPLALTALPTPKQEFNIIRREQQDASAILYTRLTNEGLTQGYSMWTIGIYAESEESEETLYRIIQFGSPRPVPPYSDGGFSYSPVIYITASNSEQVTVTINPDWVDEAATNAQIRADEAYKLAATHTHTIISAEPPAEPYELWLKPMGGISLAGTIGGGTAGEQILSTVNITGAHIGDEPPTDKSHLWFKPIQS